jgi:NADPH-dependent 2,4-dienoyl-CoA reductase/sulfur reductase-like enzyme
MAAPVVAIVGAGQAGFQAAASLRQEGFAGRVVLIGDEPVLPYQRPPLSKSYLAGQSGIDELWLRPSEFYAKQQIDLIYGEEVAAVDRGTRRLRLASGREISWDHLVFATGARYRPLPVPGAELDGTGVVRILGANGRATGVETADGRHLPADLVLICIGVIPNAELAADAGLTVDNGIVVDQFLATGDPAVFAIGDCANFPTPYAPGPVRLESVQNAVDQARCVAAHLGGRPEAYQKVPWFWSDQGDLKLQIAGITAGHDQSVIRGNPADGSFSVFCFRGGRLIGVESINRTADHVVARRLLAGEPALSPEQAADGSYDLRAHSRNLAER